MRMLILSLGVVFLFGCNEKGSDPAQIALDSKKITGKFISQSTSENGDIFITTLEIKEKAYEFNEYRYYQNLNGITHFRTYQGNYENIESVYSTELVHSTCPSDNKNWELFLDKYELNLSGNDLTISFLNQEMTMTRVSDFNRFINPQGITNFIEDTSCNMF